MNALEAIAGRSSVRSFRYREVDETAILRLLEAAVRAPTAFGREPWAFLVIQDRVTLRRISDRAKELWRAESPRRSPHEATGVPPASPHADDIWDPGSSLFYNAGTLVVIGTRAEGEFADAECWLAAENLMIAAEAMGLGTCVIGAAVPALRTAEVGREIGLPSAVRPVVPIVVGFPKDRTVPAPRRTPEILAWRR